MDRQARDRTPSPRRPVGVGSGAAPAPQALEGALGSLSGSGSGEGFLFCSGSRGLKGPRAPSAAATGDGTRVSTQPGAGGKTQD